MVNQSNKKLRLNLSLLGCLLSAFAFVACGGEETVGSASSGSATESSSDEDQQVDASASDGSTTTQSTTTQLADDELVESDGDDDSTDSAIAEDDSTDSDAMQDDSTDADDASDTSANSSDDDSSSDTTADSEIDSSAKDAIAELELLAAMAALGINPDSEAAKCMRDNKDLIADSENSGDAIYVAAKCAPSEVGAIVAQNETFGDLTPKETECVMTEALSYMANLPEAEARAAFSEDRIPAEYAEAIVPIAEEKCGVDAERFAADFTN